MAGRFLSLFKPVARVIPEIKAPERRVRFNEKLLWTAIVLVVYLIMTEVPLFGVQTTALGELAALRIIFASNRGSLMELGIGPIVTAGLILQLLVGSNMIEADMSNAEDRGLFTTASKVFSILLTGVQASAYIIGGMYGSLPGPTAVVVFLQLIAAGIIVMLLDELVQKGWGFGSGISLFIMAGVAQQIFWQSFSPAPAVGELNAYGFFVALGQILASGQPLGVMWLRANPSNPSLLGLIATVAAFLIIIYMEGVRIELPLSYAGYKGYRSRYPIKLLYVSNLPVIFASALFANVYFFSQLFWSMNGQPTPGRNFWLDLLGQYQWVGTSPNQTLQPIGGLVYYVTAPRNLINVMNAPVRAVVYLGILIVFCVVFSLTWLEVGGLGPPAVAKQLVDAGMQIPGYRRSEKAVESILARYIPAVTVLGGIVVAVVAGVSDYFGVFGSGMGILLSVGIIYQYYEILLQERATEMYPAFRRVFGE
ncbi:MAG TPA: preprotein translocase subunit SecY [Candidatus Acidoferrum sp.]|jgi:preprotein translocase SecY subunit|nr:preprotein translocase subunit SecY [Candidatus Acidoferrum sp.]